MQTWLTQMRKGLTELCVMAALGKGEAYGYEIFQRPAQTDWLPILESTVYRVLRRLARDGYVRVRSLRSSGGAARRY